MHPKHRAAAAALALLCAATFLTGCLPSAAAGPGPTPEVSESATPEPVVAASSGSRPEPRTDATCADLTNPTLLTPLFSFPVEAAPPTRTDEYIGAWISDSWFIRQLGGLSCEWSTVGSLTTSEGLFDYHGLQIKLLPATDADWSPFSSAEAGGGSRLFDCPEFRQGCQLDQHLPNGWWLEIWTEGMPHLATDARVAAAETAFTAIVDVVQALPAPSTPWTVPEPAIALPKVTDADDCESVLSSAAVQAAVGETGTITSEWNSYPGIVETALAQLGVKRCTWSKDGFYPVTSILWLPGGAWAEAEAKAAMETLIGGPVESPAVTGAPAGSTALYEHVDSWALDLVLGGNWVKVQQVNGSETGSLSQRDASIAIGAAVVANFPG